MGICESKTKIPGQLENSPQNGELLNDLAKNNVTDNPQQQNAKPVDTLGNHLTQDPSKEVNGIATTPMGINNYTYNPTLANTDTTTKVVKCAVENKEPLGQWIE